MSTAGPTPWRPARRHEHAEDVPVQVVHRVVVGLQRRGLLDVAGADDVGGLARERDARSCPSRRSRRATSTGSTGCGCRRRAACATCRARSPIRSMSPAPWIAEITTRRSVATGDCSASSPNAFSSASARRSSMRASSAITCSDELQVGLEQGAGRELHRRRDLQAHVRERVGEGRELLLVLVAHAHEPSSDHRERAGAVGEPQVNGRRRSAAGHGGRGRGGSRPGSGGAAARTVPSNERPSTSWSTPDVPGSGHRRRRRDRRGEQLRLLRPVGGEADDGVECGLRRVASPRAVPNPRSPSVPATCAASPSRPEALRTSAVTSAAVVAGRPAVGSAAGAARRCAPPRRAPPRRRRAAPGCRGCWRPARSAPRRNVVVSVRASVRDSARRSSTPVPVDTTAVRSAGSRPSHPAGVQQPLGDSARASTRREHPLLALDEPGRGSGVVAHVGGPHQVAGPGTVERARAGGRHDRAEDGVEHGALDAHVDPAHGLDQRGRRRQVDGDEAGDRQAR